MPADSIKKQESKYEETRRRISRFKNKFNISDREIIEELSEEIEKYRHKIKILEEECRKNIDSERNTFKCAVDYGEDEYTVTRWFEDGYLIKEEIRPANK